MGDTGVTAAFPLTVHWQEGMTARGFVYLSTATLTYGVLHVVDKAALTTGADSSSYTIARIFIAALTLGCFTAVTNRSPLKNLTKRENFKDLIVIGILASGWGVLVQMRGLTSTTAINAGLLLTLVAPMTTLFAVFFLGEVLSRGIIVATILMATGVATVYGLDQASAFGTGDMLIVLAVTGYAYSNVHARKTMKNMDTTTVTLGRLIFGTLSILLLIPFLGVSFSSLNDASVLVLTAGVIFAIRMVAYYKGIEIEGASVAATFLLASPVVTALAANIFLHEPLTPGIFIGIALTAAGGWFLVTARNPVIKPRPSSGGETRRKDRDTLF